MTILHNFPIDIKGIVHKFFSLSFKSLILDSNVVWYSWFWPEGSINGQNSTFLGFHFVPRDLDSRRHKGPRLAAQGTSTRGAEDLDSRRHGTLTQIYKKKLWTIPLKLLLFLTKFNRANLVVFTFSDYNFAEYQNNLRSPDFQDCCFLDVWSKPAEAPIRSYLKPWNLPSLTAN